MKDHALFITPAKDCYWDAALQLGTEPKKTGSISAVATIQTNPTILSDGLMLSWIPIVLIRNPILVYESWLRAEGEPYPDLESQCAKIYTTLKYQRSVVDWYRLQSSSGDASALIVLDADDVIERRDVVIKLCQLVGMDPQSLLFEWDATTTPPKFQGSERLRRFLKTISDSTNVMQGKSSRGVTLEGKEHEWIKTFGSEKASILRKRIVESWPDYQYLRSMRLQ